jgi:hypothetical protein
MADSGSRHADTAAETVSPQQIYFRLHNGDELVAKP